MSNTNVTHKVVSLWTQLSQIRIYPHAHKADRGRKCKGKYLSYKAGRGKQPNTIP